MVPTTILTSSSLCLRLKAQEPWGRSHLPERDPPAFAVRNADEMVLFPRIETFFDLTGNSDLALGFPVPRARTSRRAMATPI